MTEKLLKSRLQLSFKLNQSSLRNCILRAYDIAVALNAVKIELFIHGIISLAFLPLASSSLLLFRFSQSPSIILISPFPNTSFHISHPFDVLSLFAIFHTFPHCVFHVTPTARPSAIFATQQTRRYRDEADEMTLTPVNF